MVGRPLASVILPSVTIITVLLIYINKDDSRGQLEEQYRSISQVGGNAMLMLSVGDEVVLASGEDAGSIGEVLAVNYEACLGPQAHVQWHGGTTSWIAIALLDSASHPSLDVVALNNALLGQYVAARDVRQCMRSSVMASRFACNPQPVPRGVYVDKRIEKHVNLSTEDKF